MLYLQSFHQEIIGQGYNRENIHAMNERMERNRTLSRRNSRLQEEEIRRQRQEEENRRKRQEEENRRKRKIQGIKRAAAVIASGAILATGIQIGKNADEDIKIFPPKNPPVVETMVPNFEPDITPMPTPAPTLEPIPTPEIVQYASLQEAYRGLPEDSMERKAIEKAVAEATGITDGSNVEAFLEIVDRNFNAGTDIFTVYNFIAKAGLYVTKASVAEGIKSQEGSLSIDDIRIVQSNDKTYTSVVVKGEEKYKADWNLHRSGMLEPFANETLSRIFINDVNSIVKLSDAIQENEYGEATGLARQVYDKILTICADRTNGMNTYGLEDGKLGVKTKVIEPEIRSINMRDVLEDDGR